MKNAPKHLSAEAKGWWKAILREWDLEDSALLVLASALESFDRMRQAQALIEAEGLVVTNHRGEVRAHPAVTIERDSRASMARLFKSLGLDLEPVGPIGRPPGR